jgi:hypothetical protein
MIASTNRQVALVLLQFPAAGSLRVQANAGRGLALLLGALVWQDCVPGRYPARWRSPPWPQPA